MQRAGFWYLLFLYASFFSIVCGDIQLKVDDSPVVGVPSTVTWTREEDDKKGFSIQAFRSNVTKSSQRNPPVQVNVGAGTKTGTVQITFHRAGPHILQAFDGGGDKNNQDVIAKSAPFNVQEAAAPTTSAVAVTSTITVTPAATPSSTSILSSSISSIIPPSVTTSSLSDTTTIPSPSSVPSVTSAGTTDAMLSPQNDLSSRTPIIVGSTIGTFVFVLILAALLIIFLRRRRKRYISPMFSQARMVNSSGKDDDSPFPKFSNYNPDLEAAYGGLQPAPPTYRHPTFSGGFSIDQKSSMFLDDQESTLRFVPLTDRQMELEERIIEWQSQLIGADKGTVQRVQTKIATLKQLQGSDWARERTDEVPAGLYKE